MSNVVPWHENAFDGTVVVLTEEAKFVHMAMCFQVLHFQLNFLPLIRNLKHA